MFGSECDAAAGTDDAVARDRERERAKAARRVFVARIAAAEMGCEYVPRASSFPHVALR